MPHFPRIPQLGGSIHAGLKEWVPPASHTRRGSEDQRHFARRHIRCRTEDARAIREEQPCVANEEKQQDACDSRCD
jgi:hypothetical protein